MKYTHVILCTVFLLITSNLKEIQAAAAIDSLKENIAGQYEKIMQLKPTEDAENDFAVTLMNYNSAVKALLENEEEYGKDSTMILLARQTLKRYSEVDGILNTYVGKIRLAKSKIDKNSDVVGSAEEKKLPDLLKETAEETRKLKLTGNWDYDFASIISYHCQGALNIIDDYMNKADDKVLEIVAQRLRDENQMSVQLIEKWKSEKK